MHQKGFQEYKGIISYLGDRIRQNGVFSAVSRILKYARRYFFITRIIKYLSFIIAIVETSAIMIILAAILVIVIPIMLILTGIAALIGIRKRKEFNVILSPLFDGKRNIMFIYTEQGYYNKKSTFLRGMARDFKERGYAVFVVSSNPIHDRFTTATEIDDGLYIIKLGYFYGIKKRFLKNFDTSKLTYIS